LIVKRPRPVWVAPECRALLISQIRIPGIDGLMVSGESRKRLPLIGRQCGASFRREVLRDWPCRFFRRFLGRRIAGLISLSACVTKSALKPSGYFPLASLGKIRSRPFPLILRPCRNCRRSRTTWILSQTKFPVYFCRDLVGDC